MNGSVEQLEWERRRRAVYGVGTVLLLALVAFLVWSIVVGEWPLSGLLAAIAAAVASFVAAARAGRVRVAGYGFSLLTLGGIVAGTIVHGNPGYAPFFVTVGVVLSVVTLAPRDVAVVFVLGMISLLTIYLIPTTGPPLATLGGVHAQGAMLYLIVGCVAVAAAWSAHGQLRDLRRRDADAAEADDRARALALQLEHGRRMEALGRLAGGVAHDFNNLLTVMKVCVDSVSASRRATGDDFEHLRLAIDRGANLTRQLLTFSRGEAGPSTTVDVCEAVRHIRDILRRMAGAEVALTVDADSGPLHVPCSEAQIEQVIMNLVVNAGEAMDGKGEVHVRIAREHDPSLGDVCRLSVRDTGPGMSDEIKARVFEPFFTTKRAGKGTGLGLATIYGIATSVGGRIDVASAPGEGATFTVTLPLVAPRPVACPEATPPVARTSRVVWLVEDEPTLRTLVRRVLEAEGHEVHAFDRAEAVPSDPSACDVLISDVSLPGQSGVALAETMLERKPSLRVVLVSGFAQDPAAIARVVGRGARFLPKPFVYDELLDVVAGVVRERPHAAASGASV